MFTNGQTMDNKRSEKLTWDFSSGELKRKHQKHKMITVPCCVESADDKCQRVTEYLVLILHIVDQDVHQ